MDEQIDRWGVINILNDAIFCISTTDYDVTDEQLARMEAKAREMLAMARLVAEEAEEAWEREVDRYYEEAE